jgi:hypothetical protein
LKKARDNIDDKKEAMKYGVKWTFNVHRTNPSCYRTNWTREAIERERALRNKDTLWNGIQ